jgi:hypothetical protein
MSELTFSQSERHNFLVPILIALVIVGGVFAYVYLRPHRIADVTITHTAILPTHTVFKSPSKLVGHQDEVQDDLYVVANVHVVNHLKIPLFIENITGTLTTQDDSIDPITTEAIAKSELDNVYVTFPALKPLASTPLPREIAIQPGEQAEGMVLIHFPVSDTDWNQRKSATANIEFYHQGTVNIAIPKP